MRRAGLVAKLALGLLGCVMATMAFALTDPTRPVVLEASGHISVMKDGTQMVLVSEDRQVALVDGVYVSVGDHVRNGEVVGITDRGVEVFDYKKGKLSMLTVTGEKIKIKSFSSMDNSRTKVD
ncbi:MAG: hypothetical protein ACHQAX_03535 [Gammaproteobacteria bacterium]